MTGRARARSAAARRPGDAAADDEEIGPLRARDCCYASTAMARQVLCSTAHAAHSHRGRCRRRRLSRRHRLRRAGARCRNCSISRRSVRAASSCRARCVWELHGDAIRKASTEREPILVPDGERFKNIATVGARVRSADPARRRSRDRRSSPSAAASSATWSALPRRPICAACGSCRCRRR